MGRPKSPSQRSGAAGPAAFVARWNPWQGLGVLPRGIWVLFATMLVNRLGTMVLPFLTLYLTQALGFDAGPAALVLTVYGLGSIVAAPVAGRLADRVGSLAVMRVSLFLTAGTLALFPLARSGAAVAAAAVILAIVSEAYRPASMALVTAIVPPEHRKAAYAVSRLAINLGMSIGPALGGFIAAKSFRAIFWVDGATSLAAGLILVAVPLGVAVGRAARDRAALAETNWEELHAVPVSLAGPESAAAPAARAGVLRDRRMVPFLIANVLVAAGFFQHIAAMPLYLVRDLGFSPKFYGLLFSLNTVLIVILEVRINFLTAHWSHRRSLLSGALLVGAGFGALAFARTPWPIAATVVVWTFGEMILLPSMSNYVADVAPADRRGEYMGYYTMAWGIAFSFGPGLGTLVLDRYGPPACWLGTLVFCATGGWIMSRLEGARAA